jgi:hypothetical protein
MSRKGTILVRVQQDRMGSIVGAPIDKKWGRRFAAVAEMNGGSNDRDFFFQSPDEFLEDMPVKARREVERGWPVTFRVDPWVVGHWYGYDAHAVAETPWKELVRHEPKLAKLARKTRVRDSR